MFRVAKEAKNYFKYSSLIMSSVIVTMSLCPYSICINLRLAALWQLNFAVQIAATLKESITSVTDYWCGRQCQTSDVISCCGSRTRDAATAAAARTTGHI